MKVCTKCNEKKHKEMFTKRGGKHGINKDGSPRYTSICKKCKSKINIEYKRKIRKSQDNKSENKYKAQFEIPGKLLDKYFGNQKIEDFLYIEIFNDTIKKLSKQNPQWSSKWLKRKTLDFMKELILSLTNSRSQVKQLYGKILVLEKEYLRKYEIYALKKHIEKKTGLPANGVYSPKIIGKVLSLHIERCRQIEKHVIALMQHPLNAGKLRQYNYN